ncbi:Lipopolysaccharide export system ATP-binding protein LptB [Dermatophilus congolensis]|uniref:Lipopolysaccharide export system ATP-binding protein LptB n=1 Tax=Dermatophilus congolensis TaxID=1863 RepID=A0AA46GZX4_9MICO|nr:Lipopolysaccharide export system ATP-binding protein LptB [Dermatophilus congolensis]
MAIRVENIKKTLGRKEVIRDISFTAPTGKITGVLGPNGAGKTTTFKIMLNIMSSDNSESCVTYGGDRLASFSLPLTRVGFSMEIDAMDKRRKAVDHLRSYAPLADCSDSRIDELLEQVGLGYAKKAAGRLVFHGHEAAAISSDVLTG